jgi:hypothetical protein
VKPSDPHAAKLFSEVRAWLAENLP